MYILILNCEKKHDAETMCKESMPGPVATPTLHSLVPLALS